jgi:hypothetical protein
MYGGSKMGVVEAFKDDDKNMFVEVNVAGIGGGRQQRVALMELRRLDKKVQVAYTMSLENALEFSYLAFFKRCLAAAYLSNSAFFAGIDDVELTESVPRGEVQLDGEDDIVIPKLDSFRGVEILHSQKVEARRDEHADDDEDVLYQCYDHVVEFLGITE